MPDLFSDPNDPYLYLDFLETHGIRWVPIGARRGTPALKTAFQALLTGGATIDGGRSGLHVMQLIPAEAEDTFDARGRTQSGFQFEWKDIDGAVWHVHAHSPDDEAPAGSIARSAWVIRIFYAVGKKKTYLRSLRNPDPRTLDPWWSSASGPETVRATHIHYTET